eukprot:961551-Rhodomonas_salina.3
MRQETGDRVAGCGDRAWGIGFRRERVDAERDGRQQEARHSRSKSPKTLKLKETDTDRRHRQVGPRGVCHRRDATRGERSVLHRSRTATVESGCGVHAGACWSKADLCSVAGMLVPTGRPALRWYCATRTRQHRSAPPDTQHTIAQHNVGISAHRRHCLVRHSQHPSAPRRPA